MDKIIIKYLSGTASEEEKGLLLKWLEESEKNAKTFSDLKHVWTLKEISPCSEESFTYSNFPFNIYKKPGRRREKFFRVLSISAAAVLILIVPLLMVMQKRINSYKQDISYMLSQSGLDYEYSTPFGVKGKVILPDGSSVHLNSGSKINFPGKFSGNIRDISFSGEGYFDIASDSLRPMIINLSSGIKVNITGTSFNLSSYDNDKEVSLLLLSGKVSISNTKGREMFVVKPNEKVVINLNNNKQSVENPQDLLSTIGWKRGWLVFEESNLEEVFKKMERWYGQKIVVNDKSVYNKKLTAKFREESVSHVFELMKQISLINYKIVDSVAYISEFR